jgi:hypothetical protein
MLVRKGPWIASLLFASAALGCGSGLSEEDAQLRCDQERESKGAFVTDEAYDQCLACFEECGDACEPQATVPASYECAPE